jgi:hypothetical protein
MVLNVLPALKRLLVLEATLWHEPERKGKGRGEGQVTGMKGMKGITTKHGVLSPASAFIPVNGFEVEPSAFALSY